MSPFTISNTQQVTVGIERISIEQNRLSSSKNSHKEGEHDSPSKDEIGNYFSGNKVDDHKKTDDSSDRSSSFLDKVIQRKSKSTKHAIIFQPDPEKKNSDTNEVVEQKTSSLNNSQNRRKSSQFNYDSQHLGDPQNLKSGLFEHKKFSDFYSRLMKNNKLWIDKCKELDSLYFVKMAQPQEPKCLVISCSDSRVVVNDCLGLKPGELFSHRNVGNLVISTDFNVQSVIQFAVQVLKVEHIIVVGHTDCGAVKAALTSKYHGLIDHWLRTIREIAEKYSDEIESIKSSYLNSNKDKSNLNNELIRKLIELSVKESVLSLCKTPIVQKAWKNGQSLFVHGYVLEIETGKLIELDINQEEWAQIEETYKFEFND